MKELAKLYNNRCFVTHDKFRINGFVLHHLWYIKEDVIRNNYPDGKKGRDLYMIDLEPLVRSQPFRFVLIKNGIHTRLDHYKRGLTRMKRENFMRLVVLVLMTRK